MRVLLQDLKYACRQLSRTPGFTFAAVFALALGIGSNIVIFSTINAVLLNSLPFRTVKEPQRLMSLYESNPALLAFIAGRLPVRFKNFMAWRGQAHSFPALEAYQDIQLDLTSDNSNSGREPEQVNGVAITPGFLQLFGITLQLGRRFSRSDAETGSHVAIVSHELWITRFSGDPNIIGRSIQASGVDYQIIGLLPAGVELPATGQGLDQSKPKLWVPLHLRPTQDEENRMALTVVGELKRGTTLGQARAEMNVIGRRLAQEHPDTNRGWGINVYPTVSEDVDPRVRTSLYVLQVAVGFVLLIACANVANLLLTKAVARAREIAVRVAVGASTWRILQQNLTESLVLSLFGGALGLLLSFGGLRLVSYLAPKDTHGFHELTIDPLVLAFALGVTLASGILFGLAPSFHSLRQSISEALSHGSRNVAGSSRRLRQALVIVEIAISLVLLAGAGLTIRSLASLLNENIGFRPDHLLTMSIALPSYRYTNPQQIARFDDELLSRVRQLSGVEAASLTTALPMRSISEQSYTLPQVPYDPNKMKVTDWARVTAEHVQALGLHLLAGRNLTRQDVYAAQPDVALVNEAFARANWPGQNPIGRVFLFAGEGGKDITYRVVGVVGDDHQFGPDATPHPEIYLPSHHMQSMLLVVRTIGNPLSMANVVKQQVWRIDKDQPLSEVDSMENVLSDWVAPRRFTMTVLLNFAIIAAILAAVGLYGVLAYAVSLRTREIGVRVALGAQPKNIAQLILRQGVALTIAGLLLGLAAAFALARFMRSLVFGISVFDFQTFLVVTAFLAIIAITATYFPAHRAARIDPIETLRAE